MKRKIMLLTGLLVSVFLYAQLADSFEYNALRISKPKFIPKSGSNEVGNEGNINAYLRNMIQYPDQAERNLEEGVVVIRFDVLPTGSLANFRIINSVSEECDNAVIMALSNTNGMWEPGVKAGVLVIMQEEVNVRFSISGSTGKRLAQSYSVKGQDCYFKGEYAKALRYFNKARLYAPNHSTTLYFTGLTKYELNDLEGALADFERVSELGSNLAAHIIPQVQDDINYARK